MPSLDAARAVEMALGRREEVPVDRKTGAIRRGLDPKWEKKGNAHKEHERAPFSFDFLRLSFTFESF